MPETSTGQSNGPLLQRSVSDCFVSDCCWFDMSFKLEISQTRSPTEHLLLDIDGAALLSGPKKSVLPARSANFPVWLALWIPTCRVITY